MLTCCVDTLNLADNITLNTLAGNSFTGLGQADIFGIAYGVGGDLTAFWLETVIN